MNKQEDDYASDSDESDEDFCPDKAEANNSDVGASEEDSDDPISDNEDDVPVSKKNTKSKTKKKGRSKQTQPQTKKTNKDSSSVVEKVEEERVVSTRNRVDTTTKSSIEKTELESDEEDSSRKEALWADFLSDIPTTTTTQSRTNKSPAVSRKVDSNKETAQPIEKKDSRVPPKEPEKVVIKQIFDFAGEEVVVEKAVSADSIKTNGSSKKTPAEAPRGSVKRPGGGLGSILGQLDKKKKISVLEKSKLDWDSFKTTEGIDEDLQTFNKGKDGYLQRQDFLERTDLRQFEIEKSLRASRRKPM
ncbi:craniofacial development protein 1 [Episyrphus balteatus]|uniref:craniofacial development protein 1 n=1 Tax=Episyrphus balteatus TaxID=286459 RepID=UPI0024859318|nr:craniofacial development protein 1 [Episyrphus balteatus]